MRLRGLLFISTTACMFGLGVVLAKLLASVLNSFLISFLALLGGGVLVAGYLFVRRKQVLPRLTRSGWGNMFLLAIFGTALPLLLVISGFARVSAVVGGVLMQGQGPAAVLFATLLLHERLTWRQMLGTGLLLLGSILVILQQGQALTWQDGGVGIALLLAGAMGYGFALIPAKRLADQADALPLTTLRLLLGACFVTPLLFFQPSLVTGTISWDLIWVAVMYVVSNFCVGYITQQASLSFLKAWEVAAVLQTLPLFTALFALLLLHETLTWLQIVGGLIVVVGGFIVARGETVAREATVVKVNSGSSVHSEP